MTVSGEMPSSANLWTSSLRKGQGPQETAATTHGGSNLAFFADVQPWRQVPMMVGIQQGLGVPQDPAAPSRQMEPGQLASWILLV